MEEFPHVSFDLRTSETEHFRAQPTIQSSMRCIQHFRQHLTKKQRKLFRKTCFRHLLAVEDMTYPVQLVHNMMLREVRTEHVIDEMWFFVSGKTIRFSAFEFGLISGLRFGPVPVLRGEGPYLLRDKYFGGLNIEVPEMERTILDMDFSTIPDEDAVRLALYCIVEKFVLPRSRRRAMDFRYLKLVEDIAAFNRYPWGTVAYELLRVHLRHVMDRRSQGLKKSLSRHDLHGCMLVFIVWMLEAIPYCARYYAVASSDPKRQISRLLKWRVTTTPTDEDVNKNVFRKHEGMVPISVLTATPDEMEKRWYAKLVRALRDVDTRHLVTATAQILLNDGTERDAEVYAPISPHAHTSIEDPLHETPSAQQFSPSHEVTSVPQVSLSHSPRAMIPSPQTTMPDTHTSMPSHQAPIYGATLDAAVDVRCTMEHMCQRITSDVLRQVGTWVNQLQIQMTDMQAHMTDIQAQMTDMQARFDARLDVIDKRLDLLETVMEAGFEQDKLGSQAMPSVVSEPPRDNMQGHILQKGRQIASTFTALRPIKRPKVIATGPSPSSATHSSIPKNVRGRYNINYNEPYSSLNHRYSGVNSEEQLMGHVGASGIQSQLYEQDGMGYGSGYAYQMGALPSSAYGHLGSGGEASYRMNMLAMDRYRPQLDNYKHSRISASMSERPIVNRSGIYDLRAMRPIYDLGFAPGPSLTFSHQGSGGWLDP